MCFTVIVSKVERIVEEFYVCFVIITWYIGSVIGSLVTIYMLSINQRKGKLILLTGGFLFVVCIAAQILSPKDHDLWRSLLSRIGLGAAVGIIYLSAIIIRLQHALFSLALFTCGFTVTMAFQIYLTKSSTELICVTLTLIYALLVLAVTKLPWNSTLQCSNEPRTHLRLIASADLRPLLYLTGVKLLTIFCYFLPFASIAVQYFNALNNEIATKINPNDNIRINFEHLLVLCCTRFILGTIAIFVYRNERCDSSSNTDSDTNIDRYLSFIYLMLTICTAIVLIALCYFDRLQFVNRLLCANKFGAGVCMVLAYIALSMCIDVIGHNLVEFDDDVEVCSFAGKSLSLIYATTCEHLVEIVFVVIYLSDLVRFKFMLMALSCVGLSICLQLATRSWIDSLVGRGRFDHFNRLEII